MTKTAFEFIGKGGTWIKTQVQHKADEGQYKNDIIKFSYKSKTEEFFKVITPLEALVWINALSSALLIHDETRARLRMSRELKS